MSPKYCSVFVRAFYTSLYLGIALTLLVQDTDLHRALVYGHGVAYVALYITLLLTSLCLYYVTCLVGPGYLSVHRYLDCEEHGDLVPSVLWRQCSVCSVNQPMRSHHCEDCNLCVRRYDHHCPCMDTCIGECNHKWYWMYLVAMAPLIWWSFSVAWSSFKPALSWPHWWHLNIFFVLDVVLLLAFGMSCVGLLAFHTYLMVRGTTTWEMISRERITYLKNLREDYNPFDEGVVKNTLTFLCICGVRQWQSLYRSKVLKSSGDTMNM